MIKTSVLLKRKPGGWLLGHPWIYRSQIQEVTGSPEPGSIVKVFWGKGLIGAGYYNPKSEITVRLLSRQDVPIDTAFFKAKFSKALDFRRRWVSDTNAWRLIS